MFCFIYHCLHSLEKIHPRVLPAEFKSFRVCFSGTSWAGLILWLPSLQMRKRAMLSNTLHLKNRRHDSGSHFCRRIMDELSFKIRWTPHLVTSQSRELTRSLNKADTEFLPGDSYFLPGCVTNWCLSSTKKCTVSLQLCYNTCKWQIIYKASKQQWEIPNQEAMQWGVSFHTSSH